MHNPRWEKCWNKNPYTTHHLLPKSKGGTNHPDNKLRLRQNQHRALHCLFDNLTPLQQLEFILDLNDSCLQWDFVQDIENVIDGYKEDVYQIWIKKWSYNW